MKTKINFNGQCIEINTCELTGISSIAGSCKFAGNVVRYIKTFKSFKQAKNYAKELLSFQEVTQETKSAISEIRREMRKAKPDGLKLAVLLNSDKYNKDF